MQWRAGGPRRQVNLRFSEEQLVTEDGEIDGKLRRAKTLVLTASSVKANSYGE